MSTEDGDGCWKAESVYAETITLMASSANLRAKGRLGGHKVLVGN